MQALNGLINILLRLDEGVDPPPYFKQRCQISKTIMTGTIRVDEIEKLEQEPGCSFEVSARLNLI